MSSGIKSTCVQCGKEIRVKANCFNWRFYEDVFHIKAAYHLTLKHRNRTFFKPCNLKALSKVGTLGLINAVLFPIAVISWPFYKLYEWIVEG